MKRFLPFVLILLVALAAVAGGRAVYRSKKASLAAAIPQPAPVAGESVETGAKPPHVHGREEEGEVVIEEFGDFQCPPCRGMAEALDKLQAEYRPRLLVVFRQFPLLMHQHAVPAAKAAEAAGSQNRFWEMHHMLYENQAEWSAAPEPQALFVSYAERLKLDLPRYKADLTNERLRARLLADQARGKSLGVTGTPTLFVNDERVPANELTPDGLHRAIEAALSGKKPIFPPANEAKPKAP